MSTTDTRAAFEAWAQSPEGGRWEFESFARFEEGPQAGHYTNSRLEGEWQAYKAATEAAKATGTAGELPEGWKIVPRKLTDEQAREIVYNINRKYKCNPMSDYLARAVWEWGIYASPNPPAEAARQPAPVVDDEAPKRVIDYITAFDKRLIGRGFDHAQRMEIVGLLVSKETQDAALAATAAPVVMPEGVTIKAFQAAHDKAWHITIKHPFGESSVRMSNQRDVQLAELIAATNRSQP